MKKINWMIVLLVLSSCSQIRNRVKQPTKHKNETLLTEQEFIRIYNSESIKTPTNRNISSVKEQAIQVETINEANLDMAPLRESKLTNILARYTNKQPKIKTVKQEAASTNGQSLNDLLSNASTTPTQNSSISIPSGNFLTQVQSKDLDRWLKYYKKNLRSLQIHANRGQVYRGLIENILTEEGLPKELYFVGLIESGFKMKATSHAAAKGPWQFMKPTAKQYGLLVNSQVDERVHLIKSTRAASRYFRNLYNIFGSWELALSAYNAGEYRVINRIMKAQSRDFRDISKKKLLPKETLNYVPKIAAVIKIHRNPAKYGLDLQHHQVHPFTGTKSLKIKKPIPLRAAARALSISLKDIRKLNPDIFVNSTPYLSNRSFELFVPGSDYSKLERTLASIKASTKKVIAKKNSKKRKVAKRKSRRSKKSSTHHIVKSGENLYLIARKYKITISELKKFNKLKKNTIHKGQKLSVVKPKIYSPIYYTVRSGDNLINIAKSLNTNVSAIKKINKLKSSRLSLSQKLRVPASKKLVHVVRRGDNLITIAKKYKNTLSFVQSVNELKNKRIYPGQKLILNKI